MARRPLRVWKDPEGDDWYANRHLPDEEFTALLKEEGVEPERIRQDWWRWIPLGDGCYTGFYFEAVPHSRGSFPVTIGYGCRYISDGIWDRDINRED